MIESFQKINCQIDVTPGESESCGRATPFQHPLKCYALPKKYPGNILDYSGGYSIFEACITEHCSMGY